MPSFGLAHPRAPFRFDRLTPAVLRRIARFPSYFGPRAADLHDPTRFRPPTGPADAEEMTGRDFLTRGTTRDRVRLVAVQPFVRELAACPYLSTLRRLDLAGNRIGPDGARLLAGSPYLGGLRELGLNGNALCGDGASALADAPWLAGIERLEVADNALAGDDLSRLLDRAARVVAIDVSRNPLGSAPVRLLRPVVRELVAVGCGLRVLSGQDGPSAIDSLDLRHNPISPAAVLGRVPFPALARLDLGFTACGLGLTSITPGSLPALHRLSLRASRITAAGLDCLTLPKVETLDIGVNPLGDAGAAATLTAFPNVVSLDISNADLTDFGLRRLVASGALARVRSLGLGWNRLSDPTPLLDLATLAALDVTGCPVGRRASVALAARFGTIRG